jgi:hypothetical protein
MTRDDLFWLAQRLLMLWLFYLGVTHIYRPPDGVSGDDSNKLAIVIPLLVALILYGVTSGASPREGRSEVHLSMRREDLLWVCCKLFGLYMLFLGVSSLILLIPVVTSSDFGMPFSWVWPGVLVYGAGGAWLFFGDSPWLHGSKARPPAD